MADDIVTRLHDWHGPVEPSLLELVVEAADEIERLEAYTALLADEIERLRAAGDALAQSHERALAALGIDWDGRQKSLRAWQEARRG